MAKNPYSYLGTSIQYPIVLEGGAVKIASAKAVIESSLIMILTTPVGSRFFLPEFGCRINELHYEPNDAVLRKLLEVYITEAIQIWETRIALVKITILTNNEQNLVNITYRILKSNEINSFVFPFFKGSPF